MNYYLLLAALWADAPENEVGTAGQKTFGHGYLGNECVVEAVGLVTLLAVEVYVLVVVGTIVVALAELIPHATVATLYGVYQMVLSKHGEGAEDARLVE